MRMALVGMILSCMSVVPSPRVQSPTPVRPGIEVFLANVPAALRGKRVALITNQSAVDRARTSDIDLIAHHKHLKLVALLAPEHGIRGDAPAGAKSGRREGSKDRHPDLLAVQVGGPWSHAGDASRCRRPDLRPAGSGRPHLDLRLDDGTGDGGGGEEREFRSSCSIGPIRSAGRSSKVRCSIRSSSRSSGCIRFRRGTG